MSADTLTEVRKCVLNHKMKAAYARVLDELKLNAGEVSDEAKMMFQLGYVEGRSEMTEDALRLIDERSAK